MFVHKFWSQYGHITCVKYDTYLNVKLSNLNLVPGCLKTRQQSNLDIGISASLIVSLGFSRTEAKGNKCCVGTDKVIRKKLK